MSSIDEGVNPAPYLDISGAISIDGNYTNTGIVYYQSEYETMYTVINNTDDTNTYIWHIFNLRNLDANKWNYMYDMIYTKLMSDPARVSGWRLQLLTNSTDIVYHFVYRGNMVMYDNIFNDIPVDDVVVNDVV